MMVCAYGGDEIGIVVVHAGQGEARVFCKRINRDTSNDPCAYLRHSSVGLAGIQRRSLQGVKFFNEIQSVGVGQIQRESQGVLLKQKSNSANQQAETGATKNGLLWV